MARSPSLAYLSIFTLLLAVALGCASPGTPWSQPSTPKSPYAGAPVNPPAQVAQGAPQPAPALYIGDPPRPVTADAAPKKMDELAQVRFEEVQTAQVVRQIKNDQPAAPAVKAETLAALRELHKRAAQRYATMENYTFRVKRREVVGSQQKPEEIMFCKVRREPWSVYFKWLGEQGKNREVVYVKGQYGNQIHSIVAAGDVPLIPAGRRFHISPDSGFLKRKSRYAISDAGMGPLIERFGNLVQALEKGDTRLGTSDFLGLVQRPEFEKQVYGTHQTLRPGNDPTLPQGGHRWMFFDTTINMPVLIIAVDENNREVEYYCHDQFQFQVPMTDDDFNPDRLWPGTVR